MITSRSVEAWGILVLGVLLVAMLWLNTRGWAFAITVVLVVLFGFLCYEEGEASRRGWRRARDAGDSRP
jgi:hypothetical protein